MRSKDTQKFKRKYSEPYNDRHAKTLAIIQKDINLFVGLQMEASSSHYNRIR